ncbi:peroxisomal membrane anchor protein conserved region-domain-containing protein [Hypoxylon rubiginosum]|uniref:Peroxisomal membrane anchor protein conserved region-domain-containing protein n=1 Tax=Hypoxylon rubiginosum TaxID=110542 RepID=A0ACB9Z7X1_9PEZI|nr:peroxisomal membrane anchor protein conserved region-domain-containing protein [Hypoxylon rubiginosum]
MSDSEDSEKPLKPSSQQSELQSEAASDTSNPQDVDTTDKTLEKARKFLQDEKVKNSSVEKVTKFLESQGLDNTQIQKLLEEEFQQDTQNASPSPIPETSSSRKENPEPEQAVEVKTHKDVETNPPAASSSTSNSPPIITYPEFLTTSSRPPPLITPTRLANILAVSGSIWTALYGVARYAVNPMVENLNDSRSDYYAHVNERLGQLVEKLEDVVSEVPYKNGKPLKSKHDEGAYEDDESTFSDPTELFHRDFGTQTSPMMLAEDRPSSRNTPNQADKPVDAQVRRLAALRASVRELNDMHIRRAEGSADINARLREIRDEVDKLGAPAMMDFSTSYDGLGYGRRSEPDDEVKKAKDAIRSVKGMFLSTRSFPTAAAR